MHMHVNHRDLAQQIHINDLRETEIYTAPRTISPQLKRCILNVGSVQLVTNWCEPAESWTVSVIFGDPKEGKIVVEGHWSMSVLA